jgi:hypothetical protein
LRERAASIGPAQVTGGPAVGIEQREVAVRAIA